MAASIASSDGMEETGDRPDHLTKGVGDAEQIVDGFPEAAAP